MIPALIHYTEKFKGLIIIRLIHIIKNNNNVENEKIIYKKVFYQTINLFYFLFLLALTFSFLTLIYQILFLGIQNGFARTKEIIVSGLISPYSLPLMSNVDDPPTFGAFFTHTLFIFFLYAIANWLKNNNRIAGNILIILISILIVIWISLYSFSIGP